MSNESKETTRNRLPVSKTLFVGDKAQEGQSLVNGVTAIRFTYEPEGGEATPLYDFSLSSVSEETRNTLAIVGARYFAQLAMQGANETSNETGEPLEEILRQSLEERFNAISDGVWSERGGERGANLITVAKVVAVVKNRITAEEAKNADADHPVIAEVLANLKTRQAAFSAKDAPDKKGELFTEHLKQIRTRKEYRETARAMFPRKPGTGRPSKINTNELLEGL